MISWEDFRRVDIRAGTVLRLEAFPDAKKPALKLWIDLGPELGVKRSSAQIVDLYGTEQLVGKQVVCVVNFPPKQIGGFISEVLVTGFPDGQNRVVLAALDKPVPNGSKLS